MLTTNFLIKFGVGLIAIGDGEVHEKHHEGAQSKGNNNYGDDQSMRTHPGCFHGRNLIVRGQPAKSSDYSHQEGHRNCEHNNGRGKIEKHLYHVPRIYPLLNEISGQNEHPVYQKKGSKSKRRHEERRHYFSEDITSDYFQKKDSWRPELVNLFLFRRRLSYTEKLYFVNITLSVGCM